jgi:hypothetical protein
MSLRCHINALPEELLAQILRTHVASTTINGKDDIDVLFRVCRLWRETALLSHCFNTLNAVINLRVNPFDMPAFRQFAQRCKLITSGAVDVSLYFTQGCDRQLVSL